MVLHTLWMVATCMISDNKELLTIAGKGIKVQLATKLSWKKKEKVTNETCIFKSGYLVILSG